MAVKTKECTHHWLVDERMTGEFCRARCKLCGAETQFEAYPPQLEKHIVVPHSRDPLWGLVDSYGYLKLR